MVRSFEIQAAKATNRQNNGSTEEKFPPGTESNALIVHQKNIVTEHTVSRCRC